MIYLHALRNFFGIWIMPETKNKNCNLKWVHIVNIVALQLLVNLCTQNRLHISFDFKEDSLRSSRKSLCFVSFKRKCTFNWIPFHLVNVLARNVVLTQFPPFCDRIRGYGIWSIHPFVNRVRFVHNFYDTNMRIPVDYRQYHIEADPRFESVLIFWSVSFPFIVRERELKYKIVFVYTTHTPLRALFCNKENKLNK